MTFYFTLHHGYAGQGMNSTLYRAIIISMVLGIRYHADQVLRGNYTGWPFTADVTLFSFSLLFYPLALIGLVLSATGKVGPRYWIVLGIAATTSFFFAHFSPWAGETPVQLAQNFPIEGLGFIATLWLGLFFALLIWMTVCAMQLHAQSKHGYHGPRRNLG